MAVHEWFSLLLAVNNITIDHHHTHVPEQHSTDRLEATDATIAFRVVNCSINSTNTCFENKIGILEEILCF